MFLAELFEVTVKLSQIELKFNHILGVSACIDSSKNLFFCEVRVLPRVLAFNVKR